MGRLVSRAVSCGACVVWVFGHRPFRFMVVRPACNPSHQALVASWKSFRLGFLTVNRKTALVTSRIPRDSRLRLVRSRPLATGSRAVTERRSRRPAPPPPEGTPAPAELARMARRGLADAARIAHWAGRALGPGRTEQSSDGSGALSDATAEQAAADLGLTPQQARADWDTARLAGLVEVHGDSARPGWRLRAWDRDDSAVLRGWVALFDAWSLTGTSPDGAAPATVAEVVEAMPQLLSLLQLSAGPVPVPQLFDLLGQRVTELRTERCEIPYGPQPQPVGGLGRQAAPLAPLLDWALHALAAVGALTCADEQVTLTPLGSWAVWVKLEQICVAAQSPAGNIEQSAEDMLRGCAGLRPNAARAEYRAWLAARPVGSAVTDLLTAARGEDALLRGLAFEALRVVGAPAEGDVRAALEETTLRPYALLWLAEHEGGDAEEAHTALTREEATWLWVDTAAAVADHGETQLLVRHLESAVQGTVPALLEDIRAIGHPRTVQVLVALAAAHPDPALAKAVRRAAFQVHRGGV